MSLVGKQADHQDVPGAEDRMFWVYQKGKGGTLVRAETCHISEQGTLVFRSQEHLVMAFSPSGWTFLEESEY